MTVTTGDAELVLVRVLLREQFSMASFAI